MRMHASRAYERSLGRPAASGTGFRADETAAVAGAALPLVLSTIGMLLLGMGALFTLMPLAFAGAGVTALGFVTYLIMVGMERSDAKRRARKDAARQRARRAKEAYAADLAAAPAPPRNPLADEAVAALSGEARGGIWPPLPSQVDSGELVMPQRPATGTPKAVSNWAPGAKVAPPGWDDAEVVEFTDVQHVAPRATLTSGGTSFVDMEEHEAVAERGRPQMAMGDPVREERDFRVWPGAKDLDSWTTFTGEKRPQTSRYSEADLKKAMDERRRQLAGRLPTVGAILADVSMKENDLDRMRREADRGKCSQCQAIIWAPKKRPIVLKCPGCGHKAKLY